MALNALLNKFRTQTGLTPDDISDTDASILLDEFAGIEAAAVAFFDRLAVEQRELVDVSESGSSRSLSRMLDNTLRLADIWRGRIPVSATTVIAASRAGRSVVAERV